MRRNFLLLLKTLVNIIRTRGLADQPPLWVYHTEGRSKQRSDHAAGRARISSGRARISSADRTADRN